MAKSNSSGPLSSIEGPVMNIISSIPVPQFMAPAKAYFNPVSTFNANKKSSTFGGIATLLVLIGLLNWLGLFLATILSSGVGTALLLLLGIVFFPLVFLVSGFIGSAIVYVAAKLLGGKGGYMEQTFAMSLLLAGAAVLSFPFEVLAGIPILGFVFRLVAFAIAIYNVYNYFLVLREIHKVSTLRTIGIMVLPGIVLVVLFVLVAAVVVSMLGLGAMAGKGMVY